MLIFCRQSMPFCQPFTFIKNVCSSKVMFLNLYILLGVFTWVVQTLNSVKASKWLDLKLEFYVKKALHKSRTKTAIAKCDQFLCDTQISWICFKIYKNDRQSYEQIQMRKWCELKGHNLFLWKLKSANIVWEKRWSRESTFWNGLFSSSKIKFPPNWPD